MKYSVYSVYDTQAQAYMTPWPHHNQMTAIRHFIGLAKDPSGLMAQYPGQFALFLIGFFDDQNGVVEAVKVPQCVGLLQEFLDKPLPGGSVVRD